MKNSRAYIYRLVAGAIAVLLLTTSALAQTQWDLDHAMACCWATDNGFCYTPSACGEGLEYCRSEVFERAGVPGAMLQCSAMLGRGDDDGAVRLFVAPAPITTSDGQTLEVSSEVASSLRAATKVMQLQSRGAGSEELMSVASDDVQISVEDSEDGGRAITVRGEGTDDLVLRYDAEGNRIPDAPEFSISTDVQAAMAETGKETMSPRGGWCAAARPTGGCEQVPSMSVGNIPGSTAPQFKSTFPSVPSSASVLPAAGFPSSNWSIPSNNASSAYDAMSIVEFVNFRLINTQAQFDQLMSFCFIPNASVAGSGACQINPNGVCPYDQNAGVTCQSIYSIQQ